MNPAPASQEQATASNARRIEASGYRAPAGGLDVPRPRVPWLRVLGVVFALVVAWMMWFVVTARSVTISTEPAHASVSVLAWPAPRLGEHWLLRPGERRIRVEATGFTTFRDNIIITDAELQTHRIELEPLPGRLRVRLTPAATADISVDGRAFGQVPGLVEDVPAGLHEIAISAPRYLAWQERISITGRGLEQDLDVTLEPAWAEVSVASTPAATVSVDGEVVGATPLELELLEGRRVMRLSADGYKTWKQTLKIEPGKDVNLGEIVLAKADGSLHVTSMPDNANVTVDGEYRGRTPLDIAVAPDKAHKLRLLREGYRPAEHSATVASGKREALHVDLEAVLATVHLETTPADAELLVDGKPAGNATQSLSLPTHEHEITIRRQGYGTYQTRITPRAGVEKRFRIRLKTSGEMAQESAATGSAQGESGSNTRRRATPAIAPGGTLTTAAGQTMKLFRGGRATLGSPRNEPGRRANEVMREVTLARPFYLGVREVSNAGFRRFLAAHESGEFKGQSLNEDTQPAARVTWVQAALYCNWLSRQDGLPLFYQIKYGEVLGINPRATGYRLPTEAEWEWAAAYPPKGQPSRFTWGDRYPPRGRSGNYADTTAAAIMGDTIAGYSDGFAVAAPVGSFTANLRGLYDLDGNVAEWVHDFYEAAPAASPATDPLGPPTGQQHVIKGGSWAQGSATALRPRFRDFGGDARDDVGFRLARYAQ